MTRRPAASSSKAKPGSTTADATAKRRAAEHLPQVQVKSRSQLRAWLEDHHGRSTGIWLVTFKKAAGAAHVPYGDVVEELLCFGWVDSLPRTLDEDRSMLMCTPRKARSAWSAANKERVERMTAAGQMRPAGIRVVEEARASGRWDALKQVDALVVPEDLGAALDKRPPARAHWDAFPPSTRRGILEWILNAKRPETRAGRVQQTAELAQQNQRANQWKGP